MVNKRYGQNKAESGHDEFKERHSSVSEHEKPSLPFVTPGECEFVHLPSEDFHFGHNLIKHPKSATRPGKDGGDDEKC